MGAALKPFEFYDFFDREDAYEAKTRPCTKDFFLDVDITVAAEFISTPMPEAYAVYDDATTTESLNTMSAQPSQTRIFWTQTFPIIAVVMGAAWGLFTRLDDSIGDTRKEALDSVRALSLDTGKRFDGFEGKLDAANKKLDDKSSEILRQMTEMRIKQVESERK